MNIQYRNLAGYFLLLSFLFFPGCSSEDSTDNTDNTANSDVKTVLLETGNTAIPYMAFNSDGSSLSVTGNSNTEISGIYTSPTGEEMFFVADANGVPREAHFKNASLVFENVRSNLMDIAVIIDGEPVRIFRDINFVNENPSLKNMLAITNNSQIRFLQKGGVRNLMRALVIAAGSAACGGTAIFFATTTLGAAFPAVVAACASPVLGLYTMANPPAPLPNGNISNEQYGIMLASNAITSLEGGLCAATFDPLSCLLTAADAAHNVFDNYDLIRQARKPAVISAQNDLTSAGTGFAIIGYQNIDRSIGQEKSKADIKLSGSITRPLISWPVATVTTIQVIKTLQQSYEIVYEVDSKTVIDSNGASVETKLDMPIRYGDYTLSNIDSNRSGPDPAPDLQPGNVYSIIIINDTGNIDTSSSASLLFSINQ